jgi:hypothetical protein
MPGYTPLTNQAQCGLVIADGTRQDMHAYGMLQHVKNK